MKLDGIRPRFVEFIPDQLDGGVLYISERFRTCSHRCCCGCGEEIVTPLSPAEWSIRREGNAVSLWPSVGNWDYACRSHYIIRRNRVLWAPPFTESQIARVRGRDRTALEQLIALANASKGKLTATTAVPEGPTQTGRSAKAQRGSLSRFLRRLFRRSARSSTS